MTRPPDPPLRIAVLVDDEYIAEWRRNALATLFDSVDAEASHVVVNERKRRGGAGRGWLRFARDALAGIRTYPLWSLVGVARQVTADQAHDRPVHIDSIDGMADAERFCCTPDPVDEYWYTLPDGVLDRLDDVDVVVRFGFGMLRGRILELPRFGVLSYHPGDIREYRGQPGGFWEFLDGESEMGVTVQRLNETLDGGEIAAFERVDIGDAHTWQEIKRRAFRTAERMLVPAVETVTDPAQSPAEPDRLGDLYRVPTGWDVVRYVVKNTRGRVRRFIERRGDDERVDREGNRARSGPEL